MHILLEHIDNLEILEWINDGEPVMNDKQFLLAIKGLRLREKSKRAAYRVLVDGQLRKEVISDTGIQKAAISTLINRIMRNFKKQLELNGLIYQEYVLPKRLIPVIDALEEEHLHKFVTEKEKKKRNKKDPQC